MLKDVEVIIVLLLLLLILLIIVTTNTTFETITIIIIQNGLKMFLLNYGLVLREWRSSF